MNTKKYRKKPIVIEAVRLKEDNEAEISAFTKGNADCRYSNLKICHAFIKTLEGEMRADIGDYIIKGVSGEFYPCKPDIFEKTYEPVKEAHT